MFKKFKKSFVDRCKGAVKASMKKIDMDVELFTLIKFEQYVKIINAILMIVAIIVLMFNSIIGICLTCYVISNLLIACIGVTGLQEDELEKADEETRRGIEELKNDDFDEKW